MTSSIGKLVLRLADGPGQTFELTKSSISLGRGAINDIVLQDATVSRNHARLEFQAGIPVIFDLDSANGLRLNGERVQQASLKPGDTISLGSCRLQFEPGAANQDNNVTLLETEADLESTLAAETLAISLNNTHQARLLLWDKDSTKEFTLDGDTVSIGRHSSNQIVLTQERVSRQHARIERRGERWFLRDLGSTNGTWVGSERIEEHALQDGDMLRIGAARLLFKAGFVNADLTFAADFTFHRQVQRKPVIFVPGIMGSELWLGSERIWPNVRLLFQRPDIFRLTEDSKLEPRGVVNEVVIVPNLIKLEQYSRMGLYLVEELGYERGKDFYEFAYDWRQDIRTSARQLAEVANRWGAGRPLTIIAHSLGTLVSRYYVECLGGKSKVERLVLMGGPHSGTPKAVTSLVHGPDVLPFGLMGQRLAEVMATFHTSYQILPTYPCLVDQNGQKFTPFDDENWLTEARRPLLRQARAFRKELGHRVSIPTVSVFGYGLETVRKLSVQREANGAWKKLSFDSAEEGDTSVPQSSAILNGSDIHPVRQYHGSLFVDNDVKMRLKLLLT